MFRSQRVYHKAMHFLRNRNKAAQRRLSTPNPGALSRRDVGEAYTNKDVYRSRNTARSLYANRRIHEVQSQQRENSAMHSLGVDWKREQALDAGLGTAPQNSDEVEASRRINRRDLSLGQESPVHGSPSAAETIQAMMNRNRAIQRRELHQQEVLALYGEAPKGPQYRKIYSQFLSSNVEDNRVAEFQKKLVEQHGIYPPQRLDAFMLGNETIFPPWVQELQYGLRDQVKYGKLGLTPEDEANKLYLARLPRDERQREWSRIKLARSYRLAKEEELSPQELRQMTLGYNKHKLLHFRRMHRALLLRRLSMRNPEKFVVQPTDEVDYSKRIAAIAKHVQVGLPTKGQWPLDFGELRRASLQKKREDRQMEFFSSQQEREVMERLGRSGTRNVTSVTIQNALDQILDEDEPQVHDGKKRLTRKTYQRRVHDIIEGVMDEDGHHYRQTARAARDLRPNAIESMQEFAFEKEARSESVTHWKRARPSSNAAGWPAHVMEQARSAGMPNPGNPQ